MIQQATLNGRPASVAYLNDAFEPVEPSAATLIKAVFTDEAGGVVFLVPQAVSKAFDPNQPRDEHGRWSDTGAGDAGGEGSPGKGGTGIKATSDGDNVKLRQQWTKEWPYHGKLDDAITAATKAQQQLGAAGEEIAKKYGLEFKNPGPKKDRARIEEKYAKSGIVADLSRGAFIVSKPEQAEAIAHDLASKFEIGFEPWKVTPVNYTDRALQVRFKDGTIGEIQIMDRAMADAKSPDKGGGHSLYVEQRKLDRVKDAARWDELTNQMKALYGKVLDGYSEDWKRALGIKRTG